MIYEEPLLVLLSMQSLVKQRIIEHFFTKLKHNLNNSKSKTIGVFLTSGRTVDESCRPVELHTEASGRTVEQLCRPVDLSQSNVASGRIDRGIFCINSISSVMFLLFWCFSLFSVFLLTVLVLLLYGKCDLFICCCLGPWLGINGCCIYCFFFVKVCHEWIQISHSLLESFNRNI
jgi:hypothetical protein